ncbi:hypothetical protein [Nonomuraea angiospora]
MEDLYREWGERPPVTRPMMQGDVFAGVTLPGFEPDPEYVQVVMHPCNMRRGAGELRDRIVVVPVVSAPQKINEKVWGRFGKIFPLPQLEGEGSADWAGDLMEPVAASSSALKLEQRVAALSDDGIYLLQQRMIFFSTRLLATLDDLGEVNAGVLTEMELQEDWCEAGVGNVPQDQLSTALDACIRDFQSWMNEGDPKRRVHLDNRREHSALRKEARREIRKRYGPSV